MSWNGYCIILRCCYLLRTSGPEQITAQHLIGICSALDEYLLSTYWAFAQHLISICSALDEYLLSTYWAFAQHLLSICSALESIFSVLAEHLLSTWSICSALAEYLLSTWWVFAQYLLSICSALRAIWLLQSICSALADYLLSTSQNLNQYIMAVWRNSIIYTFVKNLWLKVKHNIKLISTLW